MVTAAPGRTPGLGTNPHTSSSTKGTATTMLARTKRLLQLSAATTVAAGSLLGGLSGSSASADPKQLTALVGVGSDTTQDVLNALAGFSNGLLYDPVQSSTATGQKQIISFDATGSSCITPKPNGLAMNRPNGSTNGRRALSRAFDGTSYGNATCAGPVDISGLVDFARSSSGVTSTTGDLTYIPFGRDALSFGYYRADGSPVTTLTRAQLDSLFTTGPATIDGVLLIPCGIQTGSGTYQSWLSTAGVTSTEEATAVAQCLTYGARSQENDASALKTLGDAADAAVDGSQVIIGFSASAYIAKSNGVAEPNPQTYNVGIGSISNNGSNVNLGSPITGTAPALTPSSTFYLDNTFGRKVFNVVPSLIIDDFGNDDLKSIFVDSDPGATNTSTLCAATTTIQTFGFLVAPDCGSTTTRGPLITGTF